MIVKSKTIKMPAAKSIKKTVKKRTAKSRPAEDFGLGADIFSPLARPMIKIAAWTLLVALNWSGLQTVGQTVAYFYDIEATRDNVFMATNLDFSLDLLRHDGFHTQTQGGWGADPHGNNPASYLRDNFDGAFPDGLTIGETSGLTGFSARFASSTNINNFLPATGTPAPFSQNHENPTATEAGALAGQVVALTLNLGFDDYDPDFSTNTSKLRDFHANSATSPCASLTAGEVLAEANKVLAGNFSLFIPSAINDCVAEINERFDNGAPLKITPDKSVAKEITIFNDGELGFQYQLIAEQTSGDSEFCQGLIVRAYFNGNPVYTGNLLGLTHSPIVFSSTSTNQWQLQIGLPADAPLGWQNKNCGLKYRVVGWQETLPSFSEGFWDEEEVYDEISSGDWSKVLINKVYYDVDAAHGNENDNEWVELYNPADNPVDVSGWKICDNNSCDSLPANTVISAHGFALVANKATTWDYWQIPVDVIKVVLNSKIGDGLSNTADMLALKNSDGLIVDQMNWGAPNTGWANYNSNLWNPGVVDAPEGHMLGRVPNGLDTDQASDFKDLGLPQVTIVSPNGGEVWWVGRTSTVEWIATNPNGTDDQLKVDLWYSKDSGATWGNIVRGTDNDGSYSFRVPLCFDDGNGGCYYAPSHTARVKAVVWGPENFMVQNQDMSDADFCPPIDYSLLLPEEIELLKTLGMMIEEIPAPVEPPAETSTSTEATTTDIIVDNPVISTDEVITETATTTAPAIDNPVTSDSSETPAQSEPAIESGASVDDGGDSQITTRPEAIIIESEPAIQSEPETQPESPSEAPAPSGPDPESASSADLPASS